MEGQNPSVIKNYNAAQRKLDICRSERNVGPLNDFEERAHAHRPQSWHQETLTDLLDSSRNMARVRVHYKIALHQCNIILQSSFYIILQMRHPIYGILQMGHPIYGIPVPVPIKTLFLEGFCPFFVLFLAFSRTICIWHGYFSKKSDPACFFWPQESPKQKSAAPQGSPPPTQQINIRNTNQLS